MSTVKKWLLVLVVILAIASMGALFGCGKGPSAIGQERSEVKASETAPATKEIEAESEVSGTGNGIPEGPGPGDMKNPDDTQTEIIGITWVVYQYQGADGEVQEMDTNNPVKRITYTFTENNITVQWGDQITQMGTYEWYIKDQSLDNIFVHFKAAVSPDKKVEYSAADVHYNLLFESRVNDWQLTMKCQETGEVIKMKVYGQ